MTVEVNIGDALQTRDADHSTGVNLAAALLFNTKTVEAFAANVDSKNVYAVWAIANRVYLCHQEGETITRTGLTYDILGHVSQASAFRLVERFVSNGLLEVGDGGKINVTHRFLMLYESFASNFMANCEAQGIHMIEGSEEQADFALWRDPSFRY